MGRLFGTDGARGVANTELTLELAISIGRAASMVLAQQIEGRRPRIMIGKDTRISSDMLEGALAAGLCSVGADAVLLGVVPTPAVPFLVCRHQADAGIMISASHNSFEFNGIKLFAGTGYKLPDELEKEIEDIVLDGTRPFPTPMGDSLGRVIHGETFVEEYTRHVTEAVGADLQGMRIAVDCSNGSASATARRIFSSLKADCCFLSDKPDGLNINSACGSTHLEALCEKVREGGFAMGLAFDGDADRCLAVDETGAVIDGDHIMAIVADALKQEGRLRGNTLVGTVMSNMGLQRFCREKDIRLESTKVGDRYVLEKMLQGGYSLGGEQSGHVIFLDYATTGDGQLTGAMLLSILKRSGKKASELSAMMTQYPQVMINVKVSAEGKKRYESDSVIQERLAQVEELFGQDGRILVRPSGTEPLIRVMTEGADLEQIRKIAQEVAALIQERLG